MTRSVLDAPGAELGTEPAAVAPAVLTGWSVISPLGLGVGPFATGLADGATGLVPLDPQAWPVAQRTAGVVPDFDVRTVLGAKGTRSMDRATGLAVATVGMLLGTGQRNDQRDVVAAAGRDIGLVLGTGTGSAQSAMDFTRDSLTQAKPFHVDPARFPSTVMNCAAGQCAIWYGLRGPNTTIAGGKVTGLLALNYAIRLQRSGHVDTVLCGAVEELSVQRSWLEWHSRSAAERERPLGEGCAVFLLESSDSALLAGRTPLAEVMALEFGVHGRAAPAEDVLVRCVRAVLGRARVTPEQIATVALAGGDQALAAAELAAVKVALAGSTPALIRVDAVLGDTAAASAAFALAAILATAEDQHDQCGRNSRRDRAGRYRLVTSVDRDGGVGCGLLRLAGPPATAPGSGRRLGKAT